MKRVFLSLIFFYIFTIIYAENFLKNADVMGGVMFPEVITVKEGADVTLRLTSTFEEPQICTYRSPKLNENAEIGSDPHVVKFEPDLCAITVKNVSVKDEGIWRLTSKRDNDFIRGISFVNILSKDTEDEEEEEEHDVMEIKDDQYCVVSRPNEDSFPQVGKCVIPDDMPGKWNVHIGTKSSGSEMKTSVFYQVKVEKLVANVQKKSNEKKISLLCALKNSDKKFEVCRFLRVSDQFAISVSDGMGTRGYSFFGSGMDNRECGIRIENPTPQDRGLWKCFVTAYTMEQDKKDYTYFGHILDASSSPQSLRLTYPGKQVLAINSSATIKCDANFPIDHCWFKKPNGEVLSAQDTRMSKTGFNLGFSLGECQVKIEEVKQEDAGQWICSAGIAKASFEAQQFFQVDVRKTLPLLVAETSRADNYQGESFKIECRTVTKYLPLDSCRFITPAGAGFSLDETATTDSSLGAYYFDPNRSMKDGYCSLIVRRAKKEHSGQWKCFAKSSVWKTEGYDTVDVQVREAINIAAIGGSVSAIVFIVAATLGGFYIMYRKRRAKALSARNAADAQPNSPEPQRRPSQSSNELPTTSTSRAQNTPAREVEMLPIQRRPSQSSNESV